MGYTEKTQRTFDLKLNLHCQNCANGVRKIVLKIEGVVSIDIDKDLELGKATISGNVDPQTVIKKLKGANKHAELWRKEEEEESPPKINHQEMQIVLQQNPVRIDQRKVAPQPPGLISKSIDKPMERDIHDCDPKFWRILLTVACFCAYRAFQVLLVLIIKSVDKPMEIDIHDCNLRHDHDHELELKSYNKPFKCNRCGEGELELKSYNKPFKCEGCREDGFTLGYRCKHCIYDLHKDCLNPKPKITRDDLFPGSIFEFCEKPGKFCDACGKEICGHSYRCKEKNWDLHPACSNLLATLSISGTDFVLCKEVKYKCFWCNKKKPETRVAGLCYVSERNKFSCHVYCFPLVMQDAWKRGREDLDCNDDDAISKLLGKVDLKRVATAKGSGGLCRKTVTIFLKTIISILLGDPTGLIVSASTELVKGLLTL
ncbi:hypothetical protein RHMOL_Rhmol13G0029300 [Rhododendron molle]|uniref:Uncharacterized protein n=1 Tax=Rhododendron molle TaxID=49168 RepID=A0ACC0L2W2_RHOML|nr:hypothetical protein RHMOL_Rhmol13G0029300 [Rhododendron molle]